MILPLDDPQWESLYPGAAGALRKAEAAATAGALPEAVWQQLYWLFCNQGTVYLRSYAAVPHLVRLSRLATLPDRLGLIRLVAGIERGRLRVAAVPLPTEWRGAHAQALAEARSSLAVCVAKAAWDLKRALQLAEALLAFNGFPEAGFWVARMDDWTECRSCGAVLLEPQSGRAKPGGDVDRPCD